jgi:S-adenosylmethionine:tRNA ribosyltransferase-isomerase
MKVDAFDFALPEELIALRPASPRDACRLLVVHADGRLEHRRFGDIGDYLEAPDILVTNSSKVIAARLRGHRIGRGLEVRAEILLHRRLAPGRYAALARPAKKLAVGDRLRLGHDIAAEVLARRDMGEVEIGFVLAGAALDAAIAAQGEMPLPPYIATRRVADSQDSEDYQTVYAREAGSVAAPTAGLHFTPALLERLQARGVGLADVTLHVGLGTFLPVKVEDTEEHIMHKEWAELDAATADRVNRARAAKGHVVAVGTTALRALESAARETGHLEEFRGDTDIFITPGYRFRAVDRLVSNFHLPRSTLFMLVSAFMGMEVMRAAYEAAIREEYRFYSYGDACLLLRTP